MNFNCPDQWEILKWMKEFLSSSSTDQYKYIASKALDKRQDEVTPEERRYFKFVTLKFAHGPTPEDINVLWAHETGTEFVQYPGNRDKDE